MMAKLSHPNVLPVYEVGLDGSDVFVVMEMIAGPADGLDAYLQEHLAASVGNGAQVSVQDVDGLVARPDGNNVSMDREGMQLAKAQLQFKLGVQLLKSEFSTVMSAINAESK